MKTSWKFNSESVKKISKGVKEGIRGKNSMRVSSNVLLLFPFLWTPEDRIYIYFMHIPSIFYSSMWLRLSYKDGIHLSWQFILIVTPRPRGPLKKFLLCNSLFVALSYFLYFEMECKWRKVEIRWSEIFLESPVIEKYVSMYYLCKK